MEKLLYALIEKRWKPNGKEYNHVHAEYNRIMSDFGTFYRFCNIVESGSINRSLNLKLREIVSINSGLWQFVCENGMVKSIGSEIEIKNLNEGYGVVRDTDYQYRVLVSALCDEDKLEQFLLDNIKIDE